ncbi:MAG: prenyltransferase [Gammaproteobacteria bacterium]
MKLKPVIQSMRLPFLLLTPVCVFLGVSTVIANQININFYLLILVLSGALLGHISVNTLNEYFDFKSGLDFKTKRTKFSGGSGALPDNPESVRVVLAVAIASLMVIVMMGVFFVWKFGLGIMPIGVLGLVLIVTYTSWVNKYPLLCLIAPGVGFGFLMVVGTQYVLLGEYLSLSWLAAIVPFFLVNNLLLLNQYPDIQADATVGRNHFPIAYGIKNSNRVYAVFVLATMAVITGASLMGYFPLLSLIALLPMPLAFFSLYGVIKHGEMIGDYPQYLGSNVAVAILTPLLLGISIVIS